MSRATRGLRWCAAVLVAGVLSACGGTGSNNGSVKAQACSINNPYRGDATQPISGGNIGTEKTWLRDYIDRSYLWYDKVPAVDAGAAVYSHDTPTGFYTSIDTYFLDLVRPLTNPPGKPLDKFSFTYPTAAWDALINSGSSVGYGIEWHIAQASGPTPRGIRVAFVHTGSLAATRGVLRGDTLLQADGVLATDNTQQGIDALNAALFPAAGTTHTFRFSRAGTTQPDLTMAAGSVTLTPVQSSVLTAGAQKVGYILFTDHVLTAEQPLISAFSTLSAQGVSDLVLDLRYNGGGYLYIASEVGYMIAGAARTTATVPPKAFESTTFSNKRSSENATTFFEDRACLPNPQNFNCTSNAALPTLNLPRIYVLVSGSTCSASEAIVNALRGVDVEVHVIGSTTCGKPYGFFGQDNCGITYFPIEFQGVNAKGFGDYADGFTPANSGGSGFPLPGCAANDDLDHALGDPAEGQLASALSYRASGNTACLPLMFGNRQTPLAAGATAGAPGSVVKPAPLTNSNGRMPTR